MKKRIIIVGAGFGGIEVAKSLGNHPGIDVKVIDKRNHHLFQPLLYQVAIAGLSPADISFPIRSILGKYQNIDVIMDEVIKLSHKDHIIETKNGHEYQYDELIFSCGATHSYFGKEEWEDYAPGLKTVEHALEIRRRVLSCFEKAETDSFHQKNGKINFFIIGAGPTGVELAGAIAEITDATIGSDFHNIKRENISINIIEAGDRVLAQFDQTLSVKAKKSLEKFKVNVLLNERVINIDDKNIQTDKGTYMASTVIWAAGVSAPKINKYISEYCDRAGRIIVDENFNIKESENIYVIGDQANYTFKGKVLPGLAPVAIQQGRHLAKNIKRKLKSQSPLQFNYFDKGLMATIGRQSAVMQFRKLKASGFIAWLSWLFVHILYLIGFKNKLIVFIQWAWQYLFFSRGARLITQKDWKRDS